MIDNCAENKSKRAIIKVGMRYLVEVAQETRRNNVTSCMLKRAQSEWLSRKQ